MASPEWVEFQGGLIMVLDCAMILIERIHTGTWMGAYKIRFGLKMGNKNYWNIDEAKTDAIELARNTLQECLFQLDVINPPGPERTN